MAISRELGFNFCKTKTYFLIKMCGQSCFTILYLLGDYKKSVWIKFQLEMLDIIMFVPWHVYLRITFSLNVS